MKNIMKKTIVALVGITMFAPSVVSAASVDLKNCDVIEEEEHYYFVEPFKVNEINNGYINTENGKVLFSPYTINDELKENNGWERVSSKVIIPDSSSEINTFINNWFNLVGNGIVEGKAVRTNNDIGKGDRYYLHSDVNNPSDRIIGIIRDIYRLKDESQKSQLIRELKNNISSSIIPKDKINTTVTRYNDSSKNTNQFSISKNATITKNMANTSYGYFLKTLRPSEYPSDLQPETATVDACMSSSSNKDYQYENGNCEGYLLVEYVEKYQKSTCTEKQQYDVRYNGNPASEARNVPQTQTSDYDKCITIGNAPTRNGYKFVKWSTNKDGAANFKSFKPGDSYCGNDSLELYAIWQSGSAANNNVQSPKTGVGIATGLVATVLIGSTAAIIYLKRKNKFSNI